MVDVTTPCKRCGCIPNLIYRKSRIDPRTKRVIRAAPGKVFPIPQCACTPHHGA